MGEPIPGDIADPIRITTQVVPIKAGISGKKGDYLVKDGANAWYTNVAVGATGSVDISNGVIQAQEDYSSVGYSDGIVSVAGFTFNSRIYAFVAASLNPGQAVNFQVLRDNTGSDPPIVGFTDVATSESIDGRFIKVSGDSVAGVSPTGFSIGIIDLGGGA